MAYTYNRCVTCDVDEDQTANAGQELGLHSKMDPKERERLKGETIKLAAILHRRAGIRAKLALNTATAQLETWCGSIEEHVLALGLEQVDIRTPGDHDK